MRVNRGKDSRSRHLFSSPEKTAWVKEELSLRSGKNLKRNFLDQNRSWDVRSLQNPVPSLLSRLRIAQTHHLLFPHHISGNSRDPPERIAQYEYLLAHSSHQGHPSALTPENSKKRFDFLLYII